MKKAIIKVVTAAFFSVLALYLLQYVVDKGLKKSKSQFFATWNDVYGSRINADVIILGASRARLVISPKVLDSVLHINSYNLGIDGGYFPIENAMFKVYNEHNAKPKYIIQEADYFSFTNTRHLSNTEQYLPYLGDTVIRNMTSKYDERFSVPELYFPLFKYNNHLNLIKEGILCYLNSKQVSKNGMYKGFGARSTAFDDFFTLRMKNEQDYLRNNIQKDVEADFVAYLDYCKANNIKIIFVYVPLLHDAAALMGADTSEITRRLIKYSKKYDIPYLSYLNDSIGYRKELFLDHIHLNYLGAQLFSEELANDLKKIIVSGQ